MEIVSSPPHIVQLVPKPLQFKSVFKITKISTMKFTNDQIDQYIYNSNPVISLYRFAMKIGFLPDFPNKVINRPFWFLEKLKITDINSIDELIKNNSEILNIYIYNIYSNRKTDWRVTPIFLCELALIAMHPSEFTTENLVDHGWDKDIASIVIAAAKQLTNKTMHAPL